MVGICTYKYCLHKYEYRIILYLYVQCSIINVNDNGHNIPILSLLENIHYIIIIYQSLHLAI